jgi:AraC family transcriptional regulator
MPSRPSVNNVVLETSTLQIGETIISAPAPNRAEGDVSRCLCISFPARSIVFTCDGSHRLLADPMSMVFFNRHEQYQYKIPYPETYRSDWLSLSEDLVEEAFPPILVEAHVSTIRFRVRLALVDSRVFALKTLILHSLRRGPAPDPLALEETCLDLLTAIPRMASLQAIPGGSSSVSLRASRQANLTLRTVEFLNQIYEERLTLGAIARQVGASPYHLCRVFKRHTHMTLHGYRNQLRLRQSLAMILDGTELAQIAIDLGFSDQSHFTKEFRRAFRLTPAGFRHAASIGAVRQLTCTKNRAADFIPKLS